MQRLPTLLYVLSILLLVLATGYYYQRVAPIGEDSPEVERVRQQLADIIVIDTLSPRLDSVIDFADYVENVSIPYGFRLIHDPTLGSEVHLSGPAEQVRQVKMESSAGRLILSFKRVIRTSENVAVRMNFQNRGSNYLRVAGRSGMAGDVPGLESEFSTAGPLELPMVNFYRLGGPAPIEVTTAALEVSDFGSPTRLRGTANSLRINVAEGADQPTRGDFPGVTVGDFAVVYD